MTAEDGGTYREGRLQAQVEALNETLQHLQLGALRRHQEAKDRLEALEAQVRDLEHWRSYIRGQVVSWALAGSFAFSMLGELVRYLLGGRH